MKFERNVTIVGRDAVVYKATVSPETLPFGSKGEKKSYTLAITYKGNENKTVSYFQRVMRFLVYYKIGSTILLL